MPGEQQAPLAVLLATVLAVCLFAFPTRALQEPMTVGKQWAQMSINTCHLLLRWLAEMILAEHVQAGRGLPAGPAAEGLPEISPSALSQMIHVRIQLLRLGACSNVCALQVRLDSQMRHGFLEGLPMRTACQTVILAAAPIQQRGR